MCRQWKGPFEKDLSCQEWKKIIDDLRDNGIRSIHFTGGEPLLRNDLEDIIAYCSKIGLTSGLTTNGMLLDKNRLEKLVLSGLRSVAISVDALGDEYEKIRGAERSFEKVRGALEAISNIRKTKNIDSYINFTLMKNNIDVFQKVKNFADSFCIPVHLCLLDKSSSIFDTDDNKDKLWLGSKDDFEKLEGLLEYLKDEMVKDPRSLILNFPSIDYIRNYFKDPRQKKLPCVVSQDRIYIDPYGNLLSGCLSMGSFGNVKNASFKKLQKDEKYIKAKKNMFYKICPGCSCGYLFNIRCFPGLLLKDLLMRTYFSVFRHK